MELPHTEQFPDDPEQMPPARRRRANRLVAPLDANERTAFLASLAHRTSPSFDFFLFSLLSGAVLSLGLLLDAPALFVLGAILAPLMAPMIGVSLGTIVGSARYFLRSLFSLLVGSLLVFLVGALAGYAVTVWFPGSLTQAYLHAQLSWTDFLLLAVGAVLTTIAIVHAGNIPELPSVALAYELYLPLVIAGFGLTSGVPHLWPDGLVVFVIHLAWAALFGTITLAFLGLRPLTLFGYSLGGVVALLGVILVIGAGGAGAAFGGQIAIPTAIPTVTATPTATFTSTPTPLTPTATLTPTTTPTPTLTPTITPTPSPTPILALVNANSGGGAFIRAEPGGAILAAQQNGTLIYVLNETIEKDGRFWVHVRTQDGQEGWMDQSVLATATPAPAW